MREKMTGVAPLLPSVMILRSIRCVFPPPGGRGSPALQLAVDVFCAMKRVAIMLSVAFNV